MTVSERPLFGKVSINRLTEVWVPGATNLFTNPNLVAGTGTVEVRRNLAKNPRGAASGNYDEYQGRYSWTRTTVGPTTAPFSGGPTTALRLTCPSAQTGAGRGFDIGGNADIATPGTTGTWIAYPVTPGVKVTVSAWARSNRTVAGTVMTIRTHNGAGAWVGAASASTSSTLPGGVWTLYTHTITPAAGAAYLVARVTLGSVAWAANDVIDQTAVYIGLPGDYFDGQSQRTPDADLSVSWTGTANVSPSSLTGVPVAGISATRCLAIRSAKFGGSMRLIPTDSTNNVSYAEMSPPQRPSAPVTRTAVATRHLLAPLTGSLSAWALGLRSITPDAYKASANVTGSVEVRHTFTWDTQTGSGRLLFFHGGLLGSGDVYWSAPGLFAGSYDGPTFSGDTPDTATDRYAWTGTANASTSFTESNRIEFITNATSLSIRRGGSRTGIGVKTDVGLLTFTLHNDEDPLNGGTLDIGQVIQVSTPDGPIFTGRVSDMASGYPIKKSTGEERTTVQVTVSDAVMIHGSTPRYGVQIAEGFETFESRISRLASSALAPINPPVEGAPKVVYAL